MRSAPVLTAGIVQRRRDNREQRKRESGTIAVGGLAEVEYYVAIEGTNNNDFLRQVSLWTWTEA